MRASRSGRSQIRIQWAIKIMGDLDLGALWGRFPHVFSPWPGRLRASGCPPIGTPETRMVLIGVLADAPWPFPSVSHRRLPSFPRSLASPTPNGPSHTPQCGHSVPHHTRIPLTLMALTAHHMIHTALPTPTTSDTRRTRRRPVLAFFCYRPSSGVPNTLLPTVPLPNRPHSTCLSPHTPSEPRPAFQSISPPRAAHPPISVRSRSPLLP